MTEPSTHAGVTRVSKIIQAPRHKIYQAFIDPQALAAWQVPDIMRAEVHSFDAREDGHFRISLSYQNAEDAQRGKTAGGIDTYHGHFVTLVPNEKIVEVIEFETQDPRFTGEMTLTVTLTDVPGGTQVTLLHENIPAGVRPEDNEEGTRQSLQKLAALAEGR